MLLTPGPVELTRKISRAQTRPMIYHRGKEYGELHGRIVASARRLFGSEDAFIITGSGTAGVEACVASCIGEGEKVFVPHNGVFGERLREMCAVYGAKVGEKRFPYGKGIDVGRVKRELDESRASVLALVFNDTSMGVCNHAREIVEYAKRKGMFTIIDGVSAVGGHELDMREWGVDLCVTASQKCIGAPPGLALIGANREAVERIGKSRPRGCYLDLRKYVEYNAKRETPFTPAVSLMYALDVAFNLLFKEGLDARIERHRKAGEFARKALAGMGFGLFAEKGFESNTVTSFKVSPPDEAGEMMKGLREKYGITIAGGMGGMRGKILRIGHMGNFKEKDLRRCLDAIGELIR